MPKTTVTWATPVATTGKPADELLTTRELCDLLKVSLSSVYRIMQRRELPFYKLASHGIRFRAGDVDEFLRLCRVEPARTPTPFR